MHLSGAAKCGAHALFVADELDPMIDFARSVGAAVRNVFFLVCTGRGEKFTGEAYTWKPSRSCFA